MKEVIDRIAKHFKFSSLRVRLQVLVWVAIIPVLLLIVSENIIERSRKEAEIRKTAVSLVNLAEGSLQHWIKDTRSILLTSSLAEVIQKGNPASISVFLKDMQTLHPEYANFGAADLQGNVFASAVRMKKPVNALDMFWFQQTLKSRTFTVGEYQIGRITGIEVIVFGQPVVDRSGNLKFYLFASMDLKWLNRLWANIQLLPDSTFTVTDRNGIILFRYPLPADKWIGKNMAQAPIISAMRAQGNGVTEADGLDSKNRIYAFTTTDTPEGKLHMAVGVSKKAALMPINMSLAVNLLVLGLAAVFGLYLARFYSNRFIMKPIKALQSAADQFKSGDYTSRINLTDGENELITFTKIFDEMAETIETKAKDLRLFRELIDKSNDAIFIVDPETGRLLDANERASTGTGYSRKELLAMHVMDVDAVTADKSLWREHSAKIREQGHVIFETIHIRKDGTTFPVEINTRYASLDGRSYFIGIVRDITDRKKTAEDMRIMADLIDIAPASITVHDPDGNFLYANQKALEFHGYSKEEFLALNLHEIDVPEDERLIADRILQLEKNNQLSFEVSHYRKDRTTFPLLVYAKLAEWGGRKVVLSVASDLTARRKSEALIENILESVDEGFIIIDPEYRIISANRAYCKQMKSTDCDIIGRHCYEVSHHLDKPCYMADEECAPVHTFITGEPHMAIHTHYDKEGNPVYVETKSFPMKDGSGKIFAVIETLNNITEKRRLEDQLRHAQKMEAIGALAGGIAHDFNNMLSVIVGYAALMQMRMKQDDAMYPQLKEILATVDRAAQLTRGLLAFSRKQVMDLRTVNLNEIVHGFKKMLTRIIGEDIELSIVTSDENLIARVDMGQIEQVLMNLAVNSRDAMPKGGVLTIETRRITIDRDFMKAYGYGEPGKYALISISDTGTGMDEKTRVRIFEPYFTTKELGKGTGLGLAIVYGIVTQHNGYLRCYSESGKGTTFSMYIPLVKSAAEKIEKEETLAPQSGTETILIVEDDADVRELIRLILEGFGYTVIEAIDGNDAVKKFKDNKDKIQLLLSDLIMPGKNGKDAYEEIKMMRQDIRVIFISGYARDIIRRFGIEEGVEFISKPVLPNELLRKVREELDRER